MAMEARLGEEPLGTSMRRRRFWAINLSRAVRWGALQLIHRSRSLSAWQAGPHAAKATGRESISTICRRKSPAEGDAPRSWHFSSWASNQARYPGVLATRTTGVESEPADGCFGIVLPLRSNLKVGFCAPKSQFASHHVISRLKPKGPGRVWVRPTKALTVCAFWMVMADSESEVPVCERAGTGIF